MLGKNLSIYIGLVLIFASVSCASSQPKDGQGLILSDDFTTNAPSKSTRNIQAEKSKGTIGYVNDSDKRFIKLSGVSKITYKVDWPADFSSGELSFGFKFDFDAVNDKRVETTLRNQILATVEIKDTGSLMVYWIKQGYIVALFSDGENKSIMSLKTQLVPEQGKVYSVKLTWGNGIVLLINNELCEGIRPQEQWGGFATRGNRQAVVQIGSSEKSSIINSFSMTALKLVQNEGVAQDEAVNENEIDISDVPQELKKYYAPVDKVLSYPAYPMDEEDVVKLSSDNLQYMRLIFIDPHVLQTIEQARDAVKFLKSQGFNALISEYARYLMRDDSRGGRDDFHVLRTQAFEDLVRTNRLAAQAAHENGMKYYQHLTYNMIDDKLAAKHPEWLVKNLVTGAPERNRYKVFAACNNNEEFFKLWAERFERLMRETNSDGAMVDEIQLYSANECGCDICMRKFKEETGLELPKDRKGWLLDISDPVYKKWVVWRKDKVLARRKAVTEIVKRCDPNGIIMVYAANPTDSAMKMYHGAARPDEMPIYAQSIGDESEPPTSEGYGHLSHYYLHSMIYETKFNETISSKTGNGYWTLFYGARGGSKQQAGWNVRAWLLALARGTRLWYLQYYPWMQASQLAWEKRHEAFFPHLLTYANVSIPVSVSSQTFVPKVKGHPESLLSFSSLCTAMQDSHIPHRLITEYDLENGDFIKNTDLLLAMNIPAMSGKAADSIRRFAEQGGTVVLSGESSMYDEMGNKLNDFALSQLIGAHYAGSVESSKSFVIDKPNDITGDFTGELRATYGFARLKSISPDVKISGYVIDSQGKRHPGMLSRAYGKGKVVYFAGYPDAKYFIGHGYTLNRIEVDKMWRDQRDDGYLMLLSHMVHNLLPDITMKVENLPRRVFAEIHRQDTPEIKGYQVHLLNLLDTKLQSGFIAPPPPLVFPSVKDNLPDKNKPISIKVKCDGIKGVFVITPDFDKMVKLPFEQSGEYTQIELPYFYRYAMLYFVQDGLDVIKKIAGGEFTDTIPQCKPIGEAGQEYPPVGKYNPDDAVFFADSMHFQGGYLENKPSVLPMVRRYIVGKGGGQDIVTFTFELDKIEGPLFIDLCAKDNNSPIKAPIRMRLNGKEASSWKNDFSYDQWEVKRITLPADLLKSGKNVLEFENYGQGPMIQAPWFAINFIRIPDFNKPR